MMARKQAAAPPAVLTKKEAADYLRCSIATIQRYTRDGLLSPYRIGQRPRYPLAMLDRFIAEGTRHDPAAQA